VQHTGPVCGIHLFHAGYRPPHPEFRDHLGDLAATLLTQALDTSLHPSLARQGRLFVSYNP
jgi:hypothetical protein